MKQLWKNYNLSIILACLFVTCLGLQTWTGWYEFAAEQRAHGETPQLVGQGGYIWTWAAATMENWQSEFLQLLTFVILTAYFIHRGSHESKDTDDEQMALLRRLETRIANIEGSLKQEPVHFR